MNTEFEKYAREQFDGHEIEVDTEALWTDVYPHVKKEKTNRKGIWFFLFGLFAGIALICLFNHNRHNATDTNKITEISSTTEKNITEKIQITDQNNLKNQTISSSSLDPTTNTNSNNTVVTDNTFSNLKKTNNPTIKNSTSSINNNAAQVTLPPRLTTSRDRNTKIETATAKITNTKTSIITKNKNSSEKVKKTLLAVSTSSTNLSFINTLKPITINQNDVFTMIELEQKTILDAYFENLSRRKKHTKRGRLAVGVYGGFSKSTTNFSLNDSLGVNYLNERNISEKRLETLHLGFDLSLYTKNNFHLRSGVEYTRIGSVFNANSSLITSDSIAGIKEIIINTITGERDTITGLVAVTTTTEFIKKHYNYIHLIDIPIIVGYQWDYDPWSIGIEGGIYANISAKYTGEITSTADDEFYDLKEDENNWFKTNIGIQPFIGFNATYNLSDNFQIYFSPGFRFDAIFSTDKNLLQEKHATLGLRTGVRYIFD